jgi:hypothetical protein
VSKIIDTVELATSVVGDTKEIFELQLKLLRAEVQELGIFSKKMAFLGVVTLAFLLPAAFFLGLALAELLKSSTSLPMWTCYLVIFASLVVGSIAPLLQAKKIAAERKGT